MRLAELLGSELVDDTGEVVARVHDVRLLQDGPLWEATGRAAYRVHHLVAGHGAMGLHLGYGGREVAGPWLLRTVFQAWARRLRLVPWEQVRDVGHRRITMTGRYADCERLPTGRAS